MTSRFVYCNACLDGPLPAVLQEVDLPVISNADCEKMYERAGFREHIPHIFICAGYAEGGKDSCEVGHHFLRLEETLPVRLFSYTSYA